MVSQRNRILELENYLRSVGIDVNIGRNKARGHKGLFMHRPDGFRIDISKNLDDDSVLAVLLHEFAHFLHYSFDSSLKSLDFIFDDFNDDLREELIRVTVLDVPKDFAQSLYKMKDALSSDIKHLYESIKQELPQFKLSENNNVIERGLSGALKYLLKYDRVKIYNQLYSVDDLDNDFSLSEVQKNYILLKSKQRSLKRVNSRINKLNKYYNNPSELFARFVGMYYTNPEKVKNMAPNAYNKISKSEIPQLKIINKIVFG